MADCMFCDSTPCVCNKPAPKANQSRRVVKTRRPVETVNAPILTGQAYTPLPEVAPPPTVSNKNALVAESEDPELSASLRALAPILDRAEREQYAGILSLEPSRDERIVAWQRLRAYRLEQRALQTIR